MRPAAVVFVSLLAALAGALGALGIGSATGWVGNTETVVVGSDRRESGDAVSAPPPQVAPPLVGDDFDPAAIYQARSAGVVTIYALFGSDASSQPSSQGSGFVVDELGHILTNSHVVTTAGEGGGDVRSAREVFVQFGDGDRVEAEVIGHDPFNDVAVIKVDPADHELVPLPLGDSSSVVVGEPVAAIGSPFGNESSLTVGVVSATGRSIASLTSRYNVVDAIQVDAPINRGNSGGPLFDADGRVIGINAQIRSESGRNEGVGFAIPINGAKRSLEQLIANGQVEYAYVGVRTMDLTPSLARHLAHPVERGALVVEVERNSPAARAGMRGGDADDEEEFNGLTFRRGGDVIVAIDGRRVESADDVVRYVTEQLKPNDRAVFTVVRDGEERDIAIRLGRRQPTR